MTKKYVIALDEGTTSARAVIWNAEGREVASGQLEFEQVYPKPGWVEHRPEDIFIAQRASLREALDRGKISLSSIAGIGITNQRETTIVWDRKTGKPVHNAIVWQCRRTSGIVDKLVADGHGELFTQRTGLIPDSYFSATKVKWILDSVPGARERAERGDLLFGTVDTYLLWRLSGGKVHKTDYTNASRTMLFNIHKLAWDEELCKILDIPMALLPEARPSSEVYGYTDPAIVGAEVPLCGVVGDQQGALFGQCCFEEGEMKNTYGTGCFLLLNTGRKAVPSNNRLLTTVAYSLEEGKANYALEGSVFIAGAVVQWLRDGVNMIDHAKETATMAESVEHSELYLVPAFVGLGAPHWDQYARGLLIGITRDTGRANIVRAALESVAFQARDLVGAMERDTGTPTKHLTVDGGMARNDFLMQFQADILGVDVVRPRVLETTALGAAFLAGLAVDVWDGLDEIRSLWQADETFSPKDIDRDALYDRWQDAVRRSGGWAKH